MKLIIQNNRITATATDEYTGPDEFIDAPANFDITKLADYEFVDGVLTLVPSRHITRLAFRNRFTQAEKVALELASLDNPAATLAQRQQAAGLRVNLKDQENATFIDLGRPDTRAGVQQLQAAGLIGAGRAEVILDTPVLESEKFKE